MFLRVLSTYHVDRQQMFLRVFRTYHVGDNKRSYECFELITQAYSED